MENPKVEVRSLGSHSVARKSHGLSRAVTKHMEIFLGYILEKWQPGIKLSKYISLSPACVFLPIDYSYVHVPI